MIYTAVTRAREMAILVGNEPSVRRMVENDHKDLRYTGLCEMYRIYKEMK